MFPSFTPHPHRRPSKYGLAAAGALVLLAAALPASSALATGLPDGRVYEQVSEPQKNGNEAGIVLNSGTPGIAYGSAEADGEQMVYFQVGPSGETTSGTDLYSVATHSPGGGWTSRAALPPGYGANASNFEGEEPKQFMPSADLSRFVFAAGYSFQHENPNATESYGLYRSGAGDPLNPPEAEWWLTRPTFSSFSEALPQPGHISNSKPVVVGASPTLSTVYFTWNATLVPEDKVRAAHVTVAGDVPAGPYGFYEWKEGALASAAELPNHTYSPFGAVPAATQTEQSVTHSPFSLQNEVSSDGSKAFFVSPQPKYATEAGTPAELYMREQTTAGPTTVLVSRDELTAGQPVTGGQPAPGTGGETAITPVKVAPGATSYVYAAPDGSRAFFQSMDKLAKSAPTTGAPAEPAGTGPWTYEFNTASATVTYLPGVSGQILTSSADGTSFLFMKSEKVKVGREELNERTKGYETVAENLTLGTSLEYSSHGSAPVAVASWPIPATVKAEDPQQAEELLNTRATFADTGGDGAVYAFDTKAALKSATQSFNNSSAQNQVYRYEPAAAVPLACVSCSPLGTASSAASANQNGRAIADEGKRVFFATAAPLVPGDVNGVEDVYEWEQTGTGSCLTEVRELGCTYLISTGANAEPSFYLDNGESGEDVFFATREGLVPGDTDDSYDVYDARVGGVSGVKAAEPACESPCRLAGTSLSAPLLLSSQTGPSGNLVTPLVTPKKAAVKRPLTRAQKLAKALKACTKQRSRKRAACEKQARHEFAPKAKPKPKPKPKTKRRTSSKGGAR
jgi:hypothetical protein